jgi:hypothetical protein
MPRSRAGPQQETAVGCSESRGGNSSTIPTTDSKAGSSKCLKTAPLQGARRWNTETSAPAGTGTPDEPPRRARGRAASKFRNEARLYRGPAGRRERGPRGCICSRQGRERRAAVLHVLLRRADGGLSADVRHARSPVRHAQCANDPRRDLRELRRARVHVRQGRLSGALPRGRLRARCARDRSGARVSSAAAAVGYFRQSWPEAVDRQSYKLARRGFVIVTTRGLRMAWHAEGRSVSR